MKQDTSENFIDGMAIENISCGDWIVLNIKNGQVSLKREKLPQDTSEKWEKEFDKIIRTPEILAEFKNQTCVICGQPWDKSKQALKLKDFIRKTRQEVKQETIKEMKEWAMEYKYAWHNPDKDCDCETCMFVKNLLSKLNSI